MTSSALRHHAGGWILLALLLGSWQVSAKYLVASPNWPPLSSVLVSGMEGLYSGELLNTFSETLLRMFAGYAIGVFVAVCSGMVLGTSRLLYRAFEPIIEILRPIPIPAIIPPLILLFGIGDSLKLFVVSFSTFFPVFINTIQGVRSVDPVAVNVSRTFGVSRSRYIRNVVLPSSLPFVLAGMRISLSTALIVIVVVEMFAGSSGVGNYLMTTQFAMRPSDMYAAILLLALVGYSLNRIFVLIERRVIRWYFELVPA